jgi:hypothetical protein
MKVTPTALRKDLYALLDRVIETGEPLEIERKGVTLKVKAEPVESRLERIRRMGIKDLWIGDPDDIFHIDWLEEWREEWGLEKEQTELPGSSTSIPTRSSGSRKAKPTGSRRRPGKP